MTTYHGYDLIHEKPYVRRSAAMLKDYAKLLDSQGITMTLKKVGSPKESPGWYSSDGPIILQEWDVTFRSVAGATATASTHAEEGTLPNMVEIIHTIESGAEDYKSYPTWESMHAWDSRLPETHFLMCEQSYSVMTLISPKYYPVMG